MTIGSLYIGSGAILLLFGAPMMLGWVRPNGLWGVRTPAAFKSTNNWYALNRAVGRVVVGWAVTLLIAGLLMLVLTDWITRERNDRPALLASVPLIAVTIHMGVTTSMTSRRLPRAAAVRLTPNRPS